MKTPRHHRALARAFALAALTALLVPIGAVQASAKPAQAGAKTLVGEGKIVGGTVAPSTAWPSTVALLDNRASGSSAVKSQYCAGTVVNRYWILTAAHCVYYTDGSGVPAAVIDVLAGTRNLASGGQRLHVAQVRVLPGFSLSSGDHDLAMLKLATPTSAPVQAITGQSQGTPDGSSLIAVGWGTTKYQADQFQTQLRQVTLTQLPSSVCTQGYGAQFHPLSQTCVSGAGGDTCTGDGGGPLLVKRGATWVQIGIGRIGDGCGQYPTGYVRLEAFSNWVKQQINPNTTTVSAKLSATRVPVGATVSISGVVKPAKGTAQVKLQRFAGGTWSDRATGNVNQTSGAYQISFRASAAGTYTLRIRTSTGAASSTVYLKVG